MPPHSHTRLASITPEFSSSSKLDILNNIKDTSETLLKKILANHQHQNECVPPPMIISLPPPSPIAQRLAQTGIDRDTAEKLSSMFVKRAQELRDRLEACLRQGCEGLAKAPGQSMLVIMDIQTRLYKTITDNYLRQLESWSQNIVFRALDIVEVLRQRRSKDTNGSNPSRARPKPAFNHVSLPYKFSVPR